MTTDDRFYVDIEPFDRFVDAPAPRNFDPAPDTWALVVTDVEGSTKAIEAGRYRDVNALGVASIVAVRNAMPDVLVPYVFGGDGATILAPLSRREPLEQALRGLRHMASTAFDLGMRVGIVAIAELRAAGHDVLVARFRSSKYITLAALAGSGLTEGERWVKDPKLGKRYAVPDGDTAADFTGFECRWQPVPSRRGVVICLLATAVAETTEQRVAIYREVIESIEGIVDPEDRGCPVALETLRLSPVFSEFSQEARIKSAATRGAEYRRKRLRARVAAAVARFTTWTGATVGGFSAKRYTADLVINTDFRKFDDTVRMVLDVTAEQRDTIESLLTSQHAAGRVAWGIHTADATLMTCVVDDYSGNHVHFVDGADGGYALASKQLKRQLAERSRG